ncbi:MAG: hypothetical protein JXB85_10265 [Anaerolineales bacterium]|nr:hypothetical protein [Anaerolineales bacterium]
MEENTLYENAFAVLRTSRKFPLLGAAHDYAGFGHEGCEAFHANGCAHPPREQFHPQEEGQPEYGYP